MIRPRHVAALLALSVLAACADTRSGYPSLAPRPVERAVMQADPAPAAAPAVPAPLPASADIAQIVARAQAADAAFRAAVEKARPLILASRTAPEGSEAWVAGQQAYSDTESLRAPVGEALVELDRRREAATAAGREEESAATAEAGLQVQALDEAGRALLAGLMPA
ncbi:hypothetical protein [Sphingomonas sp. SRS2]|uniref:hypothetical protein n=1 Tax=Sphingomonas sp. SRS2 TaxID=133190 RepID=UPI00128CC998|nr:hypothetical protein [Sphingomonas sp. SRS2]